MSRSVARPKKNNFPALLKYWRGARGMSQLDLAHAADVSARHISFLETGRSEPSREMVLRLAATLDVPLREQNALLECAGFAAQFREGSIDELSPSILRALERMEAQQEPYPLVVMDGGYNLVRANAAAQRVLSRFVDDPSVLQGGNAFELVFDPKGARAYLEDWDRIARGLLSRLQRDLIAQPGNRELVALHSALLSYPDVPASWREHDFDIPSEATMEFRMRRGDLRMAFFTTVTMFNAPQNVTLEELHIESYCPLDEHTAELCRQLAES